MNLNLTWSPRRRRRGHMRVHGFRTTQEPAGAVPGRGPHVRALLRGRRPLAADAAAAVQRVLLSVVLRQGLPAFR